MKIDFLTIVLDGSPWIQRHHAEFEKLNLDWNWRVVEGVAASANCTVWCSHQAPRLSNDGTTEYLDALAAYDHRVVLYRKEFWNGKVAMVNEPFRTLYEPTLLIEMDADELWTAEQIKTLHDMFIAQPSKNCAWFYCDYRVGHGLRIKHSTEGYGNNTQYEWKRAWIWQPGMRFKTHEPPVMEPFTDNAFTHDETFEKGLVFRHEAYSTEKQVAFKQKYYGSQRNENGKLYADAVNLWRTMQREAKTGDALKQWMPWVNGEPVLERV